MSQAKNQNGQNNMTLDNRTFVLCSQRMQRITPTLPRKCKTINSTDEQFEQIGMSESDSESSLSFRDYENYTDKQFQGHLSLTPNTPYHSPRCHGRPTPPTRKRKVDELQQSNTVSKINKPFSNTNPKIGSKNSVQATEQEETESSISNGNNFGKQTTIEDISEKTTKSHKLEVGLKRPIQKFFDLMSEIANHVQVHSCPP